jgi:phosphatidylglycerophosphate synthase
MDRKVLTFAPMGSSGAPHRLVAYVPNALTAARLIIAVAFPFLGPAVRLPALVFAALSDALDGFIARRFGVTSWTGALLDAAADKALAVIVLATFTYEGLLQLWHLPLLLARDIAVALIYLYIMVKREWTAFRRVRPRLPGKLTTVFLFALVIAVLAWPAAARVLLWPTAAVSIIAAVDYLLVFRRAQMRHAGGQAPLRVPASGEADAG